ncbi:serine hydrolase domain-containing protein [Paeniglutamicibacter terrestris]|uniref:Beta-lactamase family protein n=1 Tax=Paeniglutamicibacter terrestris TaxID=2723403 RepID=A0ABX1G8T9_9MICC|nr:serine hydrolase domain-containing protein [Paeniglutamicibacter terrestris]NKG22678.1 beta-lactamase family protein [Paeniglutamicibacter terrestris]
MKSLLTIDSWPSTHAAAAVLSADGTVLGTHGDPHHRYALASVTKLLSSYAFLVALEEGAFELDTPAGPEGSTVKHLLAHTSGYDFAERTVRFAPGQRRLYSNAGFEVLAESLEAATEMRFGDYLSEAVLQPLGMDSTSLDGSAAAGATSTLQDLLSFANELQNPTLLDTQTHSQATHVVFPDLAGILPGYGRQKNNTWGLGFEIRSEKSPHWTGLQNSPQTYGHFGQAGTFLWVDPALEAACVTLTDQPFGPWAVEAWTPFNDQVINELQNR